MKQFRVKHDYRKSQPRRPLAVFGERNDGFTITGNSAREAIESWNAQQLPGDRLNPFYLEITEL